MSAQWTAEFVGKMHLHNVSQIEIAKKLGCTREYVNAVLNGRRAPQNAERTFRAALDEIISERAAQSE